MGTTTDFIGYFNVYPALNRTEAEYLIAFSETRHCARPDGPYTLPGNPIAESLERQLPLEYYNAVGDGQPSFWCQWVPAWDGSCLTYDGREKFNGAEAWLAYLIDHFLAAGAIAARSGLPCFDNFTFDHVVNGVVAGSQRDTRELFLLDVEDNIVRRDVLMLGDPPQWSGLLPYEEELDRYTQRRTRRRRSRETSTLGRREVAS